MIFVPKSAIGNFYTNFLIISNCLNITMIGGLSIGIPGWILACIDSIIEISMIIECEACDQDENEFHNRE